MVGRAEVAHGQLEFVTWVEGGQAGITRTVPGPHQKPRLSLDYWEGRFRLEREGERAPKALWFSTTCSEHGEIRVTAARVFAALASGRRRILGAL